MKFGTDGVRGPAGVWPIDEAGAERIGAAAARLAGAGERVLVCRDTRPSGIELSRAVCDAIAAAGAVAVDAGVLPTPAVPFAISRGRAAAGVMITASHNPAADNGFKLFTEGGRKLNEAETREVEGWLAEPPVATEGGSVTADAALAQDYLDALVALAGVDLAGRRIAIDLANGAGTRLADALRTVAGATVVPVAAGDGPINAGCGAVHPERLAEVVRMQGLDGGFALDGDGDRCVLVDDQGDVVPGDALTWLLARHRAATGLAVTVMSTGALPGLLPGVDLHITPVGDKHLQRAMQAHDLPLGAEESGHVLFADWPGGDGLLAGLRGLAAAWTGAASVSEALADFAAFPRRVDKLRVARRPPIDSLAGAAERLSEWTERLDGGRVFLRYSGTEPVLRTLVEGPVEAVVAAVSDEVVSWLREELA